MTIAAILFLLLVIQSTLLVGLYRHYKQLTSKHQQTSTELENANAENAFLTNVIIEKDKKEYERIKYVWMDNKHHGDLTAAELQFTPGTAISMEELDKSKNCDAIIL